jgi:NADPH2:quinone reductase
MKAVMIQDDKSLFWSEVPDPVLKDGEILMEVRATALNRADLMQREGSYPPPPGWPEWMGLEAAGVVLEAPADSRWKKGDKVCALLGGGGYAEKVAAPEGMVLSIPEGLSFEEAAAIPEVFATAYLNLFIEGDLKKGETFFMQAGDSGLGSATIQLAKAAGAKVITTVSSDAGGEYVRSLGADVVINRMKEDIAAVLAKHPADVALDCVAGMGLGSYLKTVNRGARWIVIATLGGNEAQLDMLDYFKRGVKLIGSTLRSRTSEMKSSILKNLEDKFWSDFTSGNIKVVIHKVLPITEAEAAHVILQNNENLGKVVLTVTRTSPQK